MNRRFSDTQIYNFIKKIPQKHIDSYRGQFSTNNTSEEKEVAHMVHYIKAGHIEAIKLVPEEMLINTISNIKNYNS